jgi:hypothetical protein
MKQEALKLAVWLENMSKLGWADNFGQELDEISAMIRRLVEELDKQGEPKAWIREDGVIAFFKQKEIDDQGFKWQPLYTTPQTKPLSDEEITVLWHKAMGLATSDENLKNNISHASLFARAIEERHGIK